MLFSLGCSKQMKALQAALIHAFPESSELEMLVDFHLKTALNRMSMAKTYDKVVFDVIKWVNSRNKVADLVNGALEENPDNPMLLKFLQSL